MTGVVASARKTGGADWRFFNHFSALSRATDKGPLRFPTVSYRGGSQVNSDRADCI